MVSRRISLAVVVVTIPMIGIVAAAGFQVVFGPDPSAMSSVRLLNRLAIASAMAGVSLVVVIAVAGRLARGSRHRVLVDAAESHERELSTAHCATLAGRQLSQA
jgi:hypothetical protein